MRRQMKLMTSAKANCCLTSFYDVTNIVSDSPEVAGWHSPGGSVLLVVAYGCIFALSVAGNMLVLYVIRRHLGYRTPTNVYITALGVSDVCSSFISFPLAVATATTTRWPLGYSVATCIMYDVMRRSMSLASTSMTALLVVDRYMTVVRLHRVQSVTTKTLLIVGVLVVLSVVASLPWYAALTSETDSSSTFWPPVCRPSAVVYDTVYMAVVSGLPAAGLACCAVRLAWTIVRSSTTVRPSTSAAGQLLFRDEMQTATTVILLVVVFVVCRSAHCVLVGLAAVSTAVSSVSLHDSRVVLDCAASMAVALSGAINPAVYAVRNPNVARVLRVGRRHRYGGYMANDAPSTSGISQITAAVPAAPPAANGSAATDLSNASQDGSSVSGACNTVDKNRRESSCASVNSFPEHTDVDQPSVRPAVNFLTSRRTSSSFSVVYITSRRRSSQSSSRTTSTLTSVVV